MSQVSPDFGYINDERRRDPRKTVRILAEISIGSSVECECTIMDISDGGAMLVIPSGYVVPEEFMLVPPSRLCRVAWRNHDRVGVAFQAVEPFVGM